jgi:anti-sigma B factor antagonist
MKITERTQNNIRIFRPQGRVDSEGAVDLEITLQEAFEAGSHHMILDLSQVTYINSAGLRILAARLTQNQGSGGDLLVASPSQKIRRVFQIIGFDRFFRLFDSVESAVQAF